MKYWVLKKIPKKIGRDKILIFEFEKVEAKTMHDAVCMVENGKAVVSPFFKNNYPKYERMWKKLDKHFLQLREMEEEIDDIIPSTYSVDRIPLTFESVIYAKDSIGLDLDNLVINIESLSDYNFEQVLLYMKTICGVL